jgi:hypothetical protein
MKNEARSRAPLLDCHGERSDDEFGTHVIAHGPVDHFAGEQVEGSRPGKASLVAGRECLLSVVQTL